MRLKLVKYCLGFMRSSKETTNLELACCSNSDSCPATHLPLWVLLRKSSPAPCSKTLRLIRKKENKKFARNGELQLRRLGEITAQEHGEPDLIDTRVLGETDEGRNRLKCRNLRGAD